MRNGRSPTLALRARGPIACFTRPELKVERVSYSVMTPSAARGLLEAVLWKPAMKWHVERIKVLAPIRFMALRRNEVNTKASTPSTEIVTHGGSIRSYFADDDRAQRNTVALRDVDYVVEAHFSLTDLAGAEDNVVKFVEMFQRRVEKGQHFHCPYLGCRECIAEVLPAANAPEPYPHSSDLGLMLWDIEYGAKKHRPRFFVARLKEGVLEVPEDPEGTLGGLAKGGAA
jgi:CRISPR-associated protein Cas5d